MRGDNSSAMFKPFPFPVMIIILVKVIIIIISIIAGRGGGVSCIEYSVYG